jgi:hypothetical protein
LNFFVLRKDIEAVRRLDARFKARRSAQESNQYQREHACAG